MEALTFFLSERFIHSAAHAGQNVRMGVEGEGDAGVTQELLDVLGMGISREQEPLTGTLEGAEAGALGRHASLDERHLALRERVGLLSRPL